MKKSKKPLKTSPPPHSPEKKPISKGGTAKPAKTDATFDEGDIRNSTAFREASAKAEACAKNPERLGQIVEDAIARSQSIPKGPFADTWPYLLAMIRLLRAYSTGAYRDIPSPSLIRILGAVIYFISPIDVIPDGILVLGIVDDAFVVGLALKDVKDDLDTFMEWETQGA